MKLEGKPLQADEGPGILTIHSKFTISGYCLSKTLFKGIRMSCSDDKYGPQ